MSTELAALIAGIALLVLAYNVPMGAPARQLCLIFGWILTVVGGVLVLLTLIGLITVSSR